MAATGGLPQEVQVTAEPPSAGATGDEPAGSDVEDLFEDARLMIHPRTTEVLTLGL
ncbi:hypothetical protein [Arthrobacter sp. SX1312]|uniref:hypothetical protein n=1 Tax=Arthrobacter sp. SX1312 TaxID=2058896 RepID=UPI0021584413|nr:hypothetical protein [Arthrobacter sp. SX1312]